MGTLKSFAALLLSVAALLTSVLALNAAQKKAEMQKAAAQTVTKAVVAAQEETALASALDSDTCEAKLLGTQVLNTEVGTLDATVSTAGPLGAIEAKLKPEKEESEEKKPDGTAQESAQENPANRSADDYNYPDFCGRLYIPAAGIDVALYNNTSQDTCNRTDSAAIFPHRPEDGGSNIVADNELESLTSVAVGSTAYVSFRVAVNRGQNKDASFIPVRAPKKFISDTLRAKLTKGASVLVFGRFESGHYEKDGQKKFYDYLSAATIQHDVNGGFSEGLLMGNLTADVVTHNTQNGGTMVTFTVASNRSYQKNGNWESATSYVSCAASGKTAEFIAAHFHKGDPIMLVGVLTSNQYQNKDGQNRTSYTVWVEKASFASRKNASQNDDVPAVTAAPTQAAPAAAPVAPAQAAPAALAVAQPSYGNYTGDDFADIDEDNLPF